MEAIFNDPKRRAELVEHEKEIVRIKREAREAVEAERKLPATPLKALTPRELLDRPRPDYLVDELLPEGALAEFVGDSETLKSFFAIHLGMTIATADRAEFFGLPVVKHGAVLYIAAEGAGAFQYRLRAWGTEHGVDITGVPFFTVASPLNLRDPGFQEQLRQIVADVRPVLVVVDTLHRCIPGSEENSSRDIGEVVGFSTRLQAESGAAILFLHHPPKGDPAGRGRGSGALYYAADTELNAVVEGEEQPDGTKVVTVAVKKQKDDTKRSFKLTNRIVPVRDELGRAMAHASGRAITSCVLALATAEDVEAKKGESAEVAKQRLQQEVTGRVREFVRVHPGCTLREIREGVKAKLEFVKDALETLQFDSEVVKKAVKRGKAWRDEYSLTVLATESPAPIEDEVSV